VISHCHQYSTSQHSPLCSLTRLSTVGSSIFVFWYLKTLNAWPDPHWKQAYPVAHIQKVNARNLTSFTNVNLPFSFVDLSGCGFSHASAESLGQCISCYNPPHYKHTASVIQKKKSVSTKTGYVFQKFDQQ
jgi:hypothetical protein